MMTLRRAFGRHHAFSMPGAVPREEPMPILPYPRRFSTSSRIMPSQQLRTLAAASYI